MGLESVGDLAINAILRKLEAEDIARVACASKRFRSSASDDTLWINLCFNELALTQPIDNLGNPFPSFKECYQAWRKAFGMYPWSLVKRVKRCWDRIKTWLTNHFPEAEATLCKGATEADIQMLENLLKVDLPLPTRILYRFHNGQEIVKANLETSTFGSSLGLIGGYSFYNHLVNVYLLPIHQIIQETQQIRRHLSFLRTSKFVLVAASSTLRRKLFFLNCSNGQLYVGTNKLRSEKDIIPCVPQDLISLHQESNGEEQQDAMLLWLEEHGRRLEHGFIKLCENEYGRSINLFPEEPPFCSTAVTNGVKVKSLYNTLCACSSNIVSYGTENISAIVVVDAFGKGILWLQGMNIVTRLSYDYNIYQDRLSWFASGALFFFLLSLCIKRLITSAH